VATLIVKYFASFDGSQWYVCCFILHIDGCVIQELNVRVVTVTADKRHYGVMLRQQRTSSTLVNILTRLLKVIENKPHCLGGQIFHGGGLLVFIYELVLTILTGKTCANGHYQYSS